MSDSIECNASTFEMEMKETAYILQNLTQASLGIKMHLNVQRTTNSTINSPNSTANTLTETDAFCTCFSES